MSLGLAHEQDRDAETEAREGQSHEEGCRPQPGLLGDEPSGQRGQGDGAVAGRLVEAHRESAPDRADQVDLHDHRARPGQALVDAEQNVGDDDPAPLRCPDEQQRHREPEQPASDENRLAAVAVRQRTRGEIGNGLGHAECQDERQDAGEGGQAEDLGRHEWQNGPLLADHSADEAVDADEQRELAGVFA